MSELIHRKDTNLNRLEKFNRNTSLANQAVRLLQDVIKFDTSNPPGNELTLAQFLKKRVEDEHLPFIKSKIIETFPNRGNLIVNVSGLDPENHPCWAFSSHLDVVPVEDGSNWKFPPFSGEIVQMEYDQFIWGRGTFDMKYMGVSYLIALFTLLREGFRPKGDIKFIFEADEERGGEEGMAILVEDYWNEVKCDCFVTEGAGFKLPTGKDFGIQIGEKGKCQIEIIAQGIPGHGSTPEPFEKLAIYKINKVIEKIQVKKRKIYMIDEYKNTVERLSIATIFKFLLKRKRIIKGLLKFLSKITGDPFDKFFIPMITDTIVPTILRAGKKVNVISPKASVSLDIRTLPGHNREFIYKKLKKIIGKELFQELELRPIDITESTSTAMNTIYYEIIRETLKEIYNGADLVPLLDMGGTDMKHMRRKGVPCYGFTLMLKDEDLTYDDLVGMAHAPNERVSVSNLMLATEFNYKLMKKL